MWTEINLNQTPPEFQHRVNEFLNNRNHSELLKVNQCEENNGEIYKYSAYLFWGNVCTVISMWNGGVLHGSFNEDSMIIGEIKEFITHPKMEFWFK